MARRPFNRFMLDIEIGRHLKLSRLNDGEFRCFVAGVLPIAAKAPVRGCLLVGQRAADADDIAWQAGTRRSHAVSAMRKLRDVGIVFHDEEFACERVHDFDDWNPTPKTDRTAAERQQRRRERARAERDVTDASRRDMRDVTPPEVEGEGEGEVLYPFSDYGSGRSPESENFTVQVISRKGAA